MSLVQRVAQALAQDGPLARHIPSYRQREGQMTMAAEVAQTMESGGVLVVEAGTGIGKTFAYVVPALLSQQKVLLSTATKALQDQLFRRDIPLLLKCLPVCVRVAMLKGRSSYLCLHRMQTARMDPRCDAPEVLRSLAQVESWAPFTRSGDLAELGGLDDDAPVLPLVTSTRENCLGSRCPQATECHVNQARRNAMLADVVVVNHHLFFADLNVRESGVAELLPSVHAVVFDEAHQLNEVGVQFLGHQQSTEQLLSLGRDVVQCTLNHSCEITGLAHKVDVVGTRCTELRSLFSVTGRLQWEDAAPSGTEPHAWNSAISNMVTALESLHTALAPVKDRAPELEATLQRVADAMSGWAQWQEPPPEGHTRWLEAGHSLRLVQAPLDISEAMRSRVLVGAHPQANQKAWIFTSATLGHEPSLSWFVDSCGLQHPKVLQVESPFDYASQASLYVPNDMPLPLDPSHSLCVADWAADAALRLGGRTMVLTTTLRAMRTIGERIRTCFQLREDATPTVWVQGEAPKSELMERFCSASENGPGGVLVASVSFWEGVDIPGAALQLVVIDKLPFAPPDDPWLQARARALEAQGKNAFKDLHLPHAAIQLKQGAGRLIRSETDYGILAVCDVRLVQKGYGKKLIRALPLMQTLHSKEEFDRALARLRSLTTTSTMDLPWS